MKKRTKQENLFLKAVIVESIWEMKPVITAQNLYAHLSVYKKEEVSIARCRKELNELVERNVLEVSDKPHGSYRNRKRYRLLKENE